jgi:hypothetical protein
LSILPTEPIKNVALLTEQDIKTMLHAQLPVRFPLSQPYF